jgi:CheY-like chemotaxis protein
MNFTASKLQGKSARILAVDDQPGCLNALHGLLVTANYDVDTASNGFEALAKLKHFLPDLVMSDLRMPVMSGFELLAVIRKRFPHITTVAVSGEVTAAEVSELLADVFLEKGSYSPSQLLTLLRELLERSPMRPRLPSMENTPVCLPRSISGNYGLTCNECLRAFAIVLGEIVSGKPRCAWCPYCNSQLPYFVDPITALPDNFVTAA